MANESKLWHLLCPPVLPHAEHAHISEYLAHLRARLSVASSLYFSLLWHQLSPNTSYCTVVALNHSYCAVVVLGRSHCTVVAYSYTVYMAYVALSNNIATGYRADFSCVEFAVALWLKNCRVSAQAIEQRMSMQILFILWTLSSTHVHRFWWCGNTLYTPLHAALIVTGSQDKIILIHSVEEGIIGMWHSNCTVLLPLQFAILVSTIASI